MEAHIEELYKEATRFDEGTVIDEGDYAPAKREQMRLYDLLTGTFGQSVLPLLDAYTDTLFDEMECEARHYFREGYLAAQREAGLSPTP